MWDDPNELARECNRIMKELEEMPEEVRVQWVRDVLIWFINLTNEVTKELEEAAQGGLRSKIALVKKAKELRERYGEEVAKRKPQIIVALTYAIKPEFQEVLAPFLYSALGLV